MSLDAHVRMTRGALDLDQLSVTDGVRSGCPAIVDGLIAGFVLRLDSEGRPLVVPLTDVAGELAEWAPEVRDAVWPVTDTAKLSSEKRAPPPTSHRQACEPGAQQPYTGG